MSPPKKPKIYHIVHVDRLPSIVADGYLWCDEEILNRSPNGTTIGMGGIKERRLKELKLESHPDLYVGQCVPFYFCPRSVMLFIIHRANHIDLEYKGGQGPILHLEADLHKTVHWLEQNDRRWAFTLSNAGSSYFEDRCDLAQLNEIEWNAIQAENWQQCKEGKQAEFLAEHCFPWQLIERIGVYSQSVSQRVLNAIPVNVYRPKIEIKSDWYY